VLKIIKSEISKKISKNAHWFFRAIKKFDSQKVSRCALYAEQILNEIANTFDGTYAGLKSMLQRFRIYFA
jgi:hypothetical protein